MRAPKVLLGGEAATVMFAALTNTAAPPLRYGLPKAFQLVRCDCDVEIVTKFL